MHGTIEREKGKRKKLAVLEERGDSIMDKWWLWPMGANQGVALSTGQLLRQLYERTVGET
jgi:hypothetical protein